MTFYCDDYNYLLCAYSGKGVVSVTHPEARRSLEKIGYMVPADAKRVYGWTIPHCMTLTKKGQQRAKQIFDAQQEKRRQGKIKYAKHHRRGLRGAAWPKSYKQLKGES